MIKALKKYWLFFSLLLLLTILASLFLFPSLTRYLSITAIILGLGMSIFITIQRHRQARKSGKITPAFMRRAIAIEITGLLLTMGIVMFIAGKIGAYVAQAAGTALGMTAAILAAIVAGLVSGALTGLLVRWGWQQLTRPLLRGVTRSA